MLKAECKSVWKKAQTFKKKKKTGGSSQLGMFWLKS